MDEHDELPPTASAAATASFGAAHHMDQPHTMASAAASSGAAMMDLPLMEPAPAAAGAEDDSFVMFEVQVLQDFVNERDWAKVEEHLKVLVSAVLEDVDPVKLHPCLFITVYREWIVDHIKNQDHRAAFKIFTDKVAILYDIKCDFVNGNDLNLQLNHLHKVADLRAPMKAAPVEAIMDTLSDYIYLYFADLPEHEKHYSHLWQFAKMLKKSPSQKNPNFRCLACAAPFNNCTISKMRDHLDIRARGRTCPKLTPNMRLRFKEGESRKGKGKTGQKRHGLGDESSIPSAHAKVGRTAKQNIAIQDNPPAADEGSDNILVAKLVDAVHASADSLHIVSAGKPLEPKVEERLRAARDLLSEVLSQKSKHG